jgi:hypothetical protein
MRAIICAALLALAITTAGAEEDLWSAGYQLTGCKKVVKEGGLAYGDVHSTVGFSAPTLAPPRSSRDRCPRLASAGLREAALTTP